MKQCLSVTRRSAFSHCRINLVNSRRNCKGVTFVTAWDCAPELATGPARSVLQLQRFVFKLLLVDQELSQEQNSQGKPVASRHFVVPNKQRALKWWLGTRVLPEQMNQPKDTHCQVRGCALTNTKSRLGCSLKSLHSSAVCQGIKHQESLESLDDVGVRAGTLWFSLESPFPEDFSREWAAKD